MGSVGEIRWTPRDGEAGKREGHNQFPPHWIMGRETQDPRSDGVRTRNTPDPLGTTSRDSSVARHPRERKKTKKKKFFYPSPIGCLQSIVEAPFPSAGVHKNEKEKNHFFEPENFQPVFESYFLFNLFCFLFFLHPLVNTLKLVIKLDSSGKSARGSS